MNNQIWKKPVIVLYREYPDQHTQEALAVLRARRLTLIKEENDVMTGRIEDFFPLMGDINRIQSDPKRLNCYILCIYDEGKKSFDQPDRLSGVVFPEGVSFIVDQKGKRTYHGSFQSTGK